MDNLDFLDLSQNGTAFLAVFTPNGLSYTFRGIDLDIISQTCPLLALSFEEGPRGRKLHSLQASSPDLVARFLRFLYTGDYITYDDQKIEIPCPLLMHVELYRYGYLFEVPHLLDEAHCSIIRACEYYCCTPNPPEDLCQTLSFIYEHLKDQQEVSDTILHYCVNCFVYHRLGENEEFKAFLADSKPFRQDIFRMNMERGFQDEGSTELIRLQIPRFKDDPALPPENAVLGDYVYDMFGSAASTPLLTPQLGPVLPSPELTYTLVHPPRAAGKAPRTDDSDGYASDRSSSSSSSSDLEGFSLVRRPKPTPASQPPKHEYVEPPKDVFADMPTGWIGYEEPTTKTQSIYLQATLSASTETIVPILDKVDSPQRSAWFEDSDSSDSEWSFVGDSETASKSIF